MNETANGACQNKNAEPLMDVVNTRVLGSKLGDGNPVSFDVANGGSGVQLHLNLLDEGKRYKTAKPRCVFWDPKIQDWSAKGCRLVSSGKQVRIRQKDCLY